jgi:prevent-host-death family protein
MLREIQASDAKAHLLRLLDDVERGETVIITRRGRPIARLVPETERRRQEISEAVAGLKALQRRTRKISTEELLSARHEGHKY